MAENELTSEKMLKATTDFTAVLKQNPSRDNVEKTIIYFMGVYTLITESEHNVYRSIDLQFATLFREAFMPLLRQECPDFAQDMIILAYNLAPADSYLERTLQEYIPPIQKPASPPRPPQP